MFGNISFHNISYAKTLSKEELEGKNLYPILEGHGIIMKLPKDFDGIFGYGTHTCSLVIVEGKGGEIGMVHIHEKIGKDDLLSFLKEFHGIQKIHVVGGSETTIKIIGGAVDEMDIHDKEYIRGQYDAVIYREGGENKIINNIKLPENFIKDKVENITHYIRDRLYVILAESLSNRKKDVPLIIENK